MKLVIAEKPGVAAEIAKALGVNNRYHGYFQNKEWTITWCVGHLCTLKTPEDYDAKYKEWNLDDLPIIPKKYELKVNPQTKEQFNIVSKFLRDDRFKFVVNATDCGREGELIFDYPYRLSGSKIPVKRFWASSALTPEVIRDGFKNLRDAAEFEGVKNAARVRSACDWVIGMNATRAITLRANIRKQVFSIGRVQTPTLAFIVQRELQIKEFKENKFYVIQSEFKTENMTYEGVYKFFDESGKLTHRIFNKNTSQDLLKQIKKQKQGQIESVDKTRKKVSPPTLFDLTSLQREANKIFGFTAEETLKIAQSLYEKHKVLSYPRTDYKHLPIELKIELIKIISALKNGNFKEGIDTALLNLKGENHPIFDNSKVGDHYGLIVMARLPENLSDDENKIYSMVLKRLLAALNEDHIYEATQVITLVDEFKFYSNGLVIVQNGWKDIYSFEEKNENQNEDQEKQSLPLLQKDQHVQVGSLKLKDDTTKPPKRLNESDLLNCMQKPYLYVQKEEANLEHLESLKAKGIGTPATRANIIKNLIDKQYISRKNNILAPTEKAIILIENLKPESLKSPLMTSEWEEKLSLIEQGKIKPSEFALEMNNFVFDIIEESEKMSHKFDGIKTNKPKSKGKFQKKKITSIQSFFNR